MKSHLLASLALPLLLTQCVDPYYPGPNGGDPYANNPYRQNLRDQGNDLNRQAYEVGIQDGRSDAQQRLAQDYRHYPSRFDRNTEMAYRDGYNQGYTLVRNSQGELGGAYPNGNQPQQPAQPQRDPAYNQGYDYGLRDRTSGRVSDPTAHVGRYDPRYRSSFERGYYDAYNSAGSSPGAPTNPGSGSNLWFR